MAGAQYDPKAVTLTIISPIPTIGTHTVTGYVDGEMINAERREDLNELVSGAQGDYAFVLKQNKTGTITVNLLQTSLSNKVFSTIAASDGIIGGGLFAVQLKDNESGSVGGAVVAKIQKHANMGYGNSLVDREWVLLCGELNMLEDAYTQL